ncbi:MAG: PspC domain-containing protein [Eggerthellaceae bacterium]|nr:PspC domain-containing protein [Eggerthellaceae bacterium]
MKSLSDYPRRERTLIVLGAVLVCLGVLGILNGYAVISWWNSLLSIIMRVIRSLLPIALIALGALIIWASRTGRLHNAFHTPANTHIHRSLYDRRILGVCGGIAQSRGLDSVIVRLAAVLLFIAFPLVTALVYIILGIVIQSE